MIPVTTYKVDQWNIHGEQISLLRQNDETSTNLKYSIIEKEQPSAKEIEIPPCLYSNVYRACNTALLFHDVIEANLCNSIEPSSFVPVLESYAWAKQLEEYVPLDHLRVALFGRGDSITKNLHEARWGVFNELDNSTKIFEIQKIEGEIQECLVNILCNGYDVAAYAGRFRIEISLDSNDKVQSLALTIFSHPTHSHLDKRILIDEHNWAITLISSPQNFSRGYVSSGHALIACEGVKGGCQFLEYVHITQKTREEGATQSPSGAWVEIVKKVSSNTLNGPTWRRPRSSVENMLLPIQEADQQRKRVPFAFGIKLYEAISPLALFCFGASLVVASYSSYRRIFAFCSYYSPRPSFSIMFRHTIRISKVVTSLMIASFSGASRYTSNKLADRYDCLNWSIEQLPKAGIHIQLPWSIITPNAAVKYLNEHLEVVVFKD